jgi:NAD(P)-dependent dehydrogenase (short-subunit alcohol dehydrogenase family)
MFGRLDVIHNNAGVLESNVTSQTNLGELPEEVWDRMFAVNVKGVWLTVKTALPWLRRSSAAAIVNCGSTSSFVAFPDEGCYCATKAAVVSLTKSLALDLAPDGIRCNCYCPSSTETEMLAGVFAAGGDRDAVRAELAASHLVPRLGRPEDVAKLVCFLASDEAAFINGATVLVDGGALAWRGFRQAVAGNQPVAAI